MSQGNPSPVQQTVVIQQAPSNGLGTAGFVVSLVGFVTCGILCPLGLLLSFFGLLKPPRGMAVAGTILGGLGSLWLVFFGFAIVAGFIGLGSAASEAAKELKRKNDETERRMLEEAKATSPEARREDQVPVQGKQDADTEFTATTPVTTSDSDSETMLPEKQEPATAVSQPPSPPPAKTSARDAEDAFRTWTDNTGKFSVEAKFIKRTMGKVTLEKRDGSKIDLSIDRLSDDDQKYVKRQGM